MKRLTFFFVLVLFSSFLFAQSEEIPDKQFMLGCTNVELSEEVTHYIATTGEVWQKSGGIFITGGIYSNSLVTVGNANFVNPNNWPGFNFSWYVGEPHWSLGLYKVTNSKQTDKYFYLDARDSDFGAAVYTPDFYIYFDNGSGVYRYKTNNEVILQAEVVRIWDIHEETPNTSGLQNYWGNALLVTNNGNDNPRIVWGPYPSPGSLPGTITGYKVYRSATHILGQTPSNFTLLATINDPEIYEYVDNSVTMGLDYNARSYYVKTVYEDQWESSGESSPTNTVEVRLQIPQKLLANNLTKVKDFDLNQNYPNPFNPETVISYSVAKNSFISLKIYDVLGNEITELVNEVKEPGNYSVSFDASNLSSGIYFYTLKANGFSLTKKMLLAK